MARRNTLLRTLPLAALAGATAAQAHVTLAEPSAPAGSYYVGFFRVSHGCSGSPTISIRIEIPPTITIARPQPKPGWTLTIEKIPSPPVAGEEGEAHEHTSAITWTGRLDADQFDQFGVMLKLPNSPGTLFFPTVQRCEAGQNDWTMQPAPGQDPHTLANPAPRLAVIPAEDAQMDRMRM